MKVLIIRFSSIGDIVLTTPVVRCIKKQVQGCTVHFLTKADFKVILENNPYIDKVYTLSTSIKETVKPLKAENYDVVIDLHNNLRTLQVKFWLAKKSYSFSKLNFKKWLLVRFKINQLPAIHIVDRYMDTAKKLGVVNDGQGLDFFVHPSVSFDAGYLPTVFANGYLCFAIGGQHRTKQLPNHKIVQVLQYINYPVVLLGGRGDEENAAEICKMIPNIPISNMCGKLTLQQSALAVKQSKGIISHDTGMMHIAAAMDVPILSVWGNTIPQLGMYPYYKKDSDAALKAKMFEVVKLKCRPCSKIGYLKCPQGHFECMERQDTNAIALEAKKLT